MLDEEEIGEFLRRAAAKQRGYAGFFGWPEKDVAEWGVVQSLSEAAVSEPGFPLFSLTRRKPGQDPPDCEAVDSSGQRVAIEVTELVEPRAIEEVKRSGVPGSVMALWERDHFLDRLGELMVTKDRKSLKGAPWDDYWILVHTDEPDLDADKVGFWLSDARLPRLVQATRAYLLMSYDPRRGGYPYFRLQ